MEREVGARLCGQGVVPGGFPVPGQQLVHLGVRQFGDAGQHIGEPGLWVDVVELAAVQGAAAVVRTQPKAAAEQLRERLFALTRHSWLDSVSDDRTVWVVCDLVGQRGRTARIDLNIEFEDGTRMTDPVNRCRPWTFTSAIASDTLWEPSPASRSTQRRTRK